MKNFYLKKMSKPKIINVTFIDPYESDNHKILITYHHRHQNLKIIHLMKVAR